MGASVEPSRMSYEDTPTLDVTERESTIEIALDRPDSLNAIDMDLATSLHELLGDLNDEPDKGLLLTGRGDVTTAGADTAIVANPDVDPTEHAGYIHEIYDRLHRYPRPTVMACKGAIVGAGFQFALACDFAVVGEETTISKAEIEHGIYSEYAVEMTAAEIGARLTREIYLSGETFDPERAYGVGFASRLVPESAVDETARDLLADLVEKDPVAYEKIKRKLTYDGDVDDFELHT